MSIEQIRTLLDTQLATVASLPYHQAENTRYEPKTAVPWVRSTMSPAETVRRTTFSDELNGLYLVDVFYPQGKGTTTAAEMAQAIKEAFPRGSRLGEAVDVPLYVMGSWIEASRDLNSHYQIPLIIKWSCIVPKE